MGKKTVAKKNAGQTEEQKDPVRITELDQYLFGQGTHYDIYKKLGAHLTKENGKNGVYFAVWAPNAKAVYLTGNFNGWSETSHPMRRLDPLGIYELFVPGIKKGEVYKYLIVTKTGEKNYKSDPFGNYCEKRPANASIVTDITKFRWSDQEWMKKRENTDLNKNPMAIYEVHPGSWKKHPATEEDPSGIL